MGICFYTNRALFQIYNGHLKKIYAANIANKVTPLILITGGAYAVCRLLGKERINNRMSLAIVSKSALTFPPPQSWIARWPGHPGRAALCSPCCRTSRFTVEVGRQPGLVRKTPTKKVQVQFKTKPKRLQRRKKRKAEGDGRGPERRPLLDSIGFFFKTSSGFRDASRRTKIHLWLMQDLGGGEAERDFLPPTSLQKTALKRDLRIPRHSFQKKKLKIKR